MSLWSSEGIFGKWSQLTNVPMIMFYCCSTCISIHVCVWVVMSLPLCCTPGCLSSMFEYMSSGLGFCQLHPTSHYKNWLVWHMTRFYNHIVATNSFQPTCLLVCQGLNQCATRPLIDRILTLRCETIPYWTQTHTLYNIFIQNLLMNTVKHLSHTVKWVFCVLLWTKSLRKMLIFYTPVIWRTYYGMALSVCPSVHTSVRPSVASVRP